MYSLPSKILASLLALSIGALPMYAAAPQPSAPTATPIQHVVVIFQENVSFDHYFATYPNAANSDGTTFSANRNTPTVNGLTAGLISANPNSVQPFRLGFNQNYTCDQDHDYGDEQKAFDQGLMDKFPETVGVGAPGCPDYGHGTGLVMGYYDGNTVTALWNYAQHYALNDNSYGTTFGPSTPGAINLISGQTHGVNGGNDSNPSDVIAGSVIGDPDPLYDDCSGKTVISMSGQNVGDLLNAKGITWGFFQGGFAPTSRKADGSAVCGAKTPNLSGALQKDYSPHHQPFQYYASTSNPHHLPPTSASMIGKTDQANHQYDLADFWNAVNSGNMPAVSFIKAKRSQDGHAGYSSPLDEQLFIADTINKLMARPEWKTTAVIVAYDDSDGWYDHVMSPILNSSATSEDALNGPGQCGNSADRSLGGYQGRCGYGPRLPLLVVSAYARQNFVDHTTTDQTSILRFIEDNWNLGRIGDGSFDGIAGPLNGMFDFKNYGANGRVFIDPVTGAVVPHGFN